MRKIVNIFIALSLSMIFLFNSTWAQAFDEKGTFFEPVKNVLVDKMKCSEPSIKGVYIPYTRMDLAVRTGVEMTRVIQTYKNNSEKNSGYNFTLPLLPDTTISQFTLWDHGKMYVASIEDRKKAERAYKEITGDEAPEFDKDPGLARKSRNLFNLRIFPICPGENKQMALVSHRRLGMEKGYFVIPLKTGRICQTVDDKGNHYKSAACDVSVYITDPLPIEEILLPDPLFKKIDLGKNRWIIRGKLIPGKYKTYEIKYKTAVPGDKDIQSVTFSDNGKNYFLLRVLAKWHMPVVEQKSARENFYLAVWRNNARLNTNFSRVDPGSFMLEMTGFLSLLFYDKSQQITGSYTNFGRPDKKEDPEEIPGIIGRDIFTLKPVSLVKNVGPPAKSDIVHRWEGGGTGHLRSVMSEDALTRPKYVIIFMDPLPETVKDELISIVKQFPGTPFIFIFEEDIDHRLRSLPNLSLFSLKEGWVRVNHDYKPLKPINFMDDLFTDLPVPMMQPLARNLFRFAGKLPNPDPFLPAIMSTGPVDITNLHAYFPGAYRYPTAKTFEPVLGCVWLTGEFHQGGTVDMDITLSHPASLASLFSRGQKSVFLALHSELSLEPGNKSNRFVGSYLAKYDVERLRSEINGIRLNASLRAMKNEEELRNGKIKLTPGEEEEINRLRGQIVTLSKRFVFLNIETAFIALPRELQEKYHFTKQDYDTGKLYDLKGMKQGGLPEPHEYILIMIIILITAGFVVFHRRKRPHPE